MSEAFEKYWEDYSNNVSNELFAQKEEFRKFWEAAEAQFTVAARVLDKPKLLRIGQLNVEGKKLTHNTPLYVKGENYA